jgi:transcriptional regulator with XRE-family HTH domain
MSDEAPQGGPEPKRKRNPEVEAAIGAQIRALRVAAGMSQTALAETIGVSFQQIQKYEKGIDRIAASTLQALAGVLKVHPGSFFDGEMPSPAGDVPDVRNALKGAAGLQRISNARVQKRLIALIDILADSVGPPTPVTSQTESSDSS